MTGMVPFDDTVARTIETMYSTADVVRQRRAVLELLDPQAGEDVLDIGTGPATWPVRSRNRWGRAARCTASIRARAC